ncbi:glycosyltransferase family 8 protein [Rosenbergiella australiborealis]|uniref:Glycosyltransferase family 8 protein n=1 Tax=Rosenbergiella australiborealis TaxID=1544696 RepID=A0ABS5T9V5_9GAMM|nr:glycosyltransferase family 8 protein [Rosenbergiella australiborealis]MBT0728295.1 glycosyltransferase family 8 protein [Rosenbergiella australiborealis]
MNAWATLLTQEEYLVGVIALQRSLRQQKTKWPLLVMVTEAITTESRQQLTEEGCRVVDITPLYPNAGLSEHYASAQFGEVWSKLRVWALTDYQRIVFLDADMLAVRNMDELFDLPLADGHIAACHACRCNPNQIASYPANWQPQACHYTWQEQNQAAPSTLDLYLNGGFLVLSPNEEIATYLADKVQAITDLSQYPFSEQDLLNEVFAGRWTPLSYGYNALKTLPFQHKGLWKFDEVKNIHYILKKPWQKPKHPTVAEQDRDTPLDTLWWQAYQPEH